MRYYNPLGALGALRLVGTGAKTRKETLQAIIPSPKFIDTPQARDILDELLDRGTLRQSGYTIFRVRE